MEAGITAIKASAGSGKTYNLTLYFLKVLGKEELTESALRKIIAITFTNKAAAEMKERIILFLKRIALERDRGLIEKTKLTPDKAEKWLDIIIEAYSNFHVKTIDSFIYSIMRAISLEEGIPTEAEVIFDKNYIVNLAFERLILKAQENLEVRRLLEELIEKMLQLEEEKGFNLEGKAKSKITSLFSEFGYLSADESEEELKKAKNELLERFEEFRRFVKENGMEDTLKKDFLKLVEKEGTPTWTEISEVFKSKNDLKKGASEEIRNAVASLKSAVEKFATLHTRYRTRTYVKLLEKLNTEIREILKSEGLMVGGHWTQRVKEFLEREEKETVAYAMLKVGIEPEYLLIDEFQDTSRQQWEALYPLVEEALSRGGSLIVVGDVKQAIYGWRGGDWRLFLEVMERKETETIVLPDNWRSKKEIILFNNKVFEKIKDKEKAVKIIKKLTPKDENDVVNRDIHNLAKVYEDVSQNPQKGEGGRITFLEATEENYLEVIEEKIKSLMGNSEDVAVLVRKNETGEEVSSFLLSKGYHVITENSLKILDHPTIRGVVSLIKYLINENDIHAFLSCALSPIGEKIARVNEIKDFLRDSEQSFETFSANHRIFANQKLISDMKEALLLLPPYPAVREIIELIEPDEKDKFFISHFLELVHILSKESSSISTVMEKLEQKGVEARIGVPEKAKGILVTTIHKAKGLEFDNVIVPLFGWTFDFGDHYILHNGILHFVKRGDSKIVEDWLKTLYQDQVVKEIVETINLVYVAFTRAIKELTVILDVTERKGGRKKYISHMVEELKEGINICVDCP